MATRDHSSRFSHPFHPLPAITLLVLCAATFFAVYLGYGRQLLAMMAFYIVASLWFAFYRYRYVNAARSSQCLGQGPLAIDLVDRAPLGSDPCRGRHPDFSLSLRAEPKEAQPRAILCRLSPSVAKLSRDARRGRLSRPGRRDRHYDIRMEPVIDHMAWRKLPLLWLKVTVFTDIPYRGVIDLLMRPHGAENFTPSHDLDYDVEISQGWPQEGVLRTDFPDCMPPLEVLTPHLALFDDDRMKELVVTPKGVRVVGRIFQAVRANYVTFREIKFPDDQVDKEGARIARSGDRHLRGVGRIQVARQSCLGPGRLL